MKMGKHSFERRIIAPHFGKKYASLFYPFRGKQGELVVQVSFQSIVRVTIIRQMAPLSSRLGAAVENGVIAAI